jgi:hypothetical protein
MEGCNALDDAELLAGFERAELACFRHRDHLRVAWLYLQAHPFEEAARLFVAGVKRLAAAKGAPEKYHQTLTWAYLALLDARLAEPGARDLGFAAFLEHNGDLLDHARGAVARLYDADTLASDLARRAFVLPG